MTTHHADVVGSLLAPPEPAEVQSYAPAREVSPNELKELQDRAIDDALAIQERAGVDVVTDGELRRVQFFDQFVVGMAGLAPGPVTSVEPFAKMSSPPTQKKKRPFGTRVGGPRKTVASDGPIS